MSKETARNLFMVSSMPRLYQHLLSGIAGYEALGNRLVQQIRIAHAFRQTESVKELARVLSNMPIKEYRLIGQYYLIWCNCRESVFKAEALDKLVEQTRTYKAKVLLSRAFIEGHQYKMEAALYFYNEALRTSPGISDYISVKLGIAQVKGMEGFHQSALKDIEQLIPIIQHAEPRLFFDLLNSYATELGTVDRPDEARNVMRVVLASPFIHAYPEWRDTAEELKPANRSFVTIGSLSYNVLALPEREPSEQPTLQLKPAQVLDLAKWKKKMAKKRKDEPDEPDENIDAMDAKDLLVKLLELTTKEDVDEEKLRKVVKFAVETMSRRKPPDKPAS